MDKKKSGVFIRSANAVKRAGRAYAWTVTGDLGELKENTKRIKDGVKGILHRKYRNESFDEAVARLRLPRKALEERANQLAAMAFLYGLIAAIALLFLSATPLVGHVWWDRLNHAAMSFGVFFVAVAKCVTTRFRAAQIRQRKFFEFKEWLLRKVKP